MTRSQVEFMAWVVNVCAASLMDQWETGADENVVRR